MPARKPLSDIPASEWKKRRLFVATPMYGGGCVGPYVESLLALQALCVGLGIELRYSFIYNESLITRARNQLAATFLASGSTHLMFIDGDIGFRAEDVLAMLGLMDEDSDFDVMAGIYPTKTIVWDRVRQAVMENKPDLSRMGSRFVVKLAPEVGSLSIDEPAKALYVGTGFMMIGRRVLDLVQGANPSLYYVPDGVAVLPDQEAAASHRIHMFFQADIDPHSKTYLSEDYWFCQRVLDAGGRIWICPWMVLDHVGSYKYSGSLSDFAT